jgi:hypothetical protein
MLCSFRFFSLFFRTCHYGGLQKTTDTEILLYTNIFLLHKNVNTLMKKAESLLIAVNLVCTEVKAGTRLCCEQNTGGHHNLEVANKFVSNVTKFVCLRIILAYGNCMHEDIKKQISLVEHLQLFAT